MGRFGVNAPWYPGDERKHAELMVGLSSQLGEQAEIVAEEQDKQKENGTPASLTRRLDNQTKSGATLDAVEDSIIQAIVEQPHTAAYFKDNLDLWNAVAREGKPTPSELMNTARDVDKWVAEQNRRKEAALQDKRSRLAQTELKEKQNAVMRDMIVRFGDWRSVDDATLRARLRISGDAVGIQTDRWNLDDFRKRGVTEAVDFGNAVNVFGIRDIAKAIRTDMYGLTPQELAEVDENSPLYKIIAKQQMIQEENDILRGQTWWADTWNSVLSSVPLMTEMALTGGESMSIRALASMGYKEAYKQFGLKGVAKMVGKGLAGAAANGAKRLPFLAPGAAAKAYNENYLGGSVTIPDGNGGATITVKDAQVDDFFAGFISQLFQQYTEVTSEELGGLIPFGNADVTLLSKLVSAKVRKAFVQKLAWSPITRNAVRRSIIDNIPFNGLLGEYAEEEIGNMMSFGATVLMTALGADLENTPGTTTPLMSWGERGQTVASVALQTLLFRASTGAVRTWGQGGAARAILDAAKAKREIEQTNNLVEMVKELPPFQTSVGESKRLLQTARRGDVTVSVAPDDASEMLSEAVEGKSKEEAKELLRTFADAGVTEESIAQAKKDGVNLALSHAGLVAIAANKNYKNGNEVKDAILGNAVSLVFGKKVKELAKDSFTVEQVKELADRLTRIDKIVSDTRKVVSKSFRTAQKNATDKGSKIGVSYRAFHDFLDVLSFKAAYLARHLKNEEGMEKLEQMVKGLSIQFAEDPEKFNASGVLAQVDNLWTGSAADYDQPSLQYVGTGEGAQVYGWGLYASESKDVAKWYAHNDVRRKGSSRRERIYLDGKLVEDPYADNIIAPIVNNIHNNGYKTTIQYLEREYERLRKPADGVLNLKAIERTKKFLDVAKRLEVKHDWMTLIQRLVDEKFMNKVWDAESMSDEELLAKVKATFLRRLEEERQNTAVAANRMLERHDEKRAEFYIRESQAAEEAIRNLHTLTDGSKLRSKKHNLYKQTFWKDKEENLLDWDDFVTSEQAEDIADGIIERLGMDELIRLVSRTVGLVNYSPLNPFRELTVSADPVAEDGYQRLFLTREGGNGYSVTISDDGIISRNSFMDRLNGQPLSALTGEAAADYIMAHRKDGDYHSFVYEPGNRDIMDLLVPELASMTGEGLYEWVEESFGSPKAASEFLYEAGIDGVTYIGDSSGVRNYVAFSDKDITVDAHIRYQNGEMLQGAIDLTKFAESQRAIISLFKDANASTLPHESAHWLKEAMESLVAAGLADEEMAADLQSVNDWLDKQDYSAEAVGKFASNAVKDGKVDMAQARDEYFARAFEQYLQDGKFPEAATSGLKSALRSLTRALQAIYQRALIMGSPINDSIRGFFDGLFTVDEVVDGTSVLAAVLREVNAEAIALGKDDMSKLEKAVAGAEKDAESEAWLAAFQSYLKGLRSGRRQWRQEAKEAYAADKAEQAFAYVKAGHRLDEAFLRDILKLDEDTIVKLKAKRLVAKGTPVAAPEAAPAEAPATPAPTGPATELTGDAEQFKNLPDDAVISLPADEAKAGDVLSSLVYGDTGRGGVIWKRAKTVKAPNDDNGLNWDNIQDSMTKGYEAAFKYATSGNPMTKADLIGAVATTAYNHIRSVWRENERIRNKGDVNLDASLENGEGDATTFGELIGGSQSVDYFGEEEEERENRLQRVSEWTDTFKDGTAKTVAEILYEFLESNNEDPSGKEVYAEYKLRGGELPEKRINTVLSEVTKSLKAYLKKPLKEQGIHTRFQTAPSNAPAEIMETMKELGYGDAMALIRDLVSAVGRKQFIRDFMSRKEAEYRDAFLDAPEWASETGATRYLNALLGAMKITDGMKFNERVKIAREAARRELMTSGSVRDIISGERNVAASLRTNASLVLKALKSGKEDKASAVSAALDMYRNAERLKAIRALRADIQRTANAARRVGKMKPGSTVDGDTLNAVKSLLKRFGLSSAEPKWTTGPNDPQCVDDVLRLMTGGGEAYLTERNNWDKWMQDVIDGKVAPTSYANLTPEQFYELMDFIGFLRGEGAESLLASKESFASKLKEAFEAILPSLEEHRTGTYTDHAKKTAIEKLGALSRSASHQGKTLLFMAHFLDGRTEFYGEHGIGPVRRFLELPLAEGESRTAFWYLGTSKAVKPHILALMKSAKDRKLSFAVNNDNRAYSVVSGEQAAFILLNAGMTENRQRVMASFGWTEEELNANLRQFTKEDFEHAEAIWKALHEMGTELAKVFYEERHYRMPWGEKVPIELTLADGTEILSEGGYFPLAYAYHDSKGKGDTDIMQPFTKVNRPARPAAVQGRVEELSNMSLLLDPMVLDRSIKENARYIGMWKPLRMANAIWTDPNFKKAVITGYGKETYDVLKDLMDHVNNPDKMEHGFWKDAANRLGSVLVVSALGFKLPTMAKQYASLTIGAERLGPYFYDAVQLAFNDLKKFRDKVAEESPFLRDRYNLIDRDLSVVNTEFKGPVGKASDKFKQAALFGLKWNDLNVASVQWWAAYQWALNNKKENFTKSEARAYADDFVASTQGAARTIDVPAVQLETLGRMLTPFFGPACAAANTRIAGLRNFGKMEAGERIAFVLDNLMIPGLTMALIAAVQRGLFFADDDDDWDRVRKQSFIALLTEPVSGVPIIQDIADGMIRSAVTGKPVNTGFFDVSLLRPAEETARDANELLHHLDNIGYSLYMGTSIAGILTGMPVVQVYEEYEKMYQWNFGDSKSKKLKQTLKQGGNGK